MKHDLAKTEKAEEHAFDFKNLYNNINDSVFYQNSVTGNIIFTNETAKRIYGYSDDEFKGMELKQLDNENNVLGIEKRIKKLREKGFIDFESVHITKGGKFIPVEVKAKTIDEKTFISVARDITERKTAEAKILAITEKWQSTFDSVNDAIWLLDKEHNILRSNKKADLLFGTGNIGKKCYDIVHGKNYPIKGCPVQLAFKQKCRKTMEFQIGDKWYDISADPILDANGNVTSAVHIVRDITTQRKTEDDLKESEEKYRTFAFNIPGMTYRAGIDWSTEMVTNLEEVSGYSNDEWDSQKMNWVNLIHPDDKQAVFKNGADLSNNPMSMIQEYRILHKDEKIRWVRDHKTSRFKDDGTFIGIDGIVFGITERKKDAEVLKESKYLYKETQKIGKMGGWSYAVESKQMTFTDTIYEIYGKKLSTAEEGIQFYHPDDKEKVWNAFSNAITKQKPYDLEVRFINAQGDDLFVRTIGKPIIKNGKVVKICGNLVNITKRKTAEKELKESEAKYRTIIENSGDAIVIRQKGKFEFANRTFLKMLDYSIIELREIKNSLIFDSDILNDMEKRFSEKDINENLSIQFETMITKKDKTKIDVEIFEKTISYKEAKAQLLIVRDITKQKAIMKDLQRGAEQTKGLNEYILICAGCSLIRDDDKEDKPWVKPADYITERLPEIQFSHGMCPDCIKKWFPDNDDKC